jgi:hypothetical protein
MFVAKIAAPVLLCIMLVPLPAMGRLVGFRVDQNTYNVVTDSRYKGLLYLYAEDIESTKGSPGFKPFHVHVLVGRYRAPLLGTKSFLAARDFEQLVMNSPEIWRDKFLITRLSGEAKSFAPPGIAPFRLVVQKVVPEKGGADHVVIDVL